VRGDNSRHREKTSGCGPDRAHQQHAYRWTFLVSGLQHPNFVPIVSQLTTTGEDKITAAAHALAA
jgi:hypothetical protein